MLTARKNFFSALSRSEPVKEERKGPQVDPVTVFVGMHPLSRIERSVHYSI